MRARWQYKVAIQFLLAHLPGGENLNNLLQRSSGSFSDSVIRERVLELARFLSKHLDVTGKSVVEIGTGWDAINSLMLYLFGARVVYTYDHVRHLRFDLAHKVAIQMRAAKPIIAEISGIDPPLLDERIARIEQTANLQELLHAAHVNYIAPGDAARTGLPDRSVDVVYSYSVLEHVPEETVASLTQEAKRILVPGGIALHNISEHDHYVSFDSSISNVNFLKYPEWLWKFFVQNKISYHNRLREKHFLEIFAANGARIESKESDIEPSDVEAVRRMKCDSRFAGLSTEELAVIRTAVVLSYDPAPRSGIVGLHGGGGAAETKPGLWARTS